MARKCEKTRRKEGSCRIKEKVVAERKNEFMNAFACFNIFMAEYSN